MFLITAINEHFKVLVSHHFVAGLTAEKKNILIKQVLMALHDRNLVITSITFDGTKTNLKCMDLLGAVLAKVGMRPVFPHPSGFGEVCVIINAVHMLKLVRNTFAAKGVLQDGLGREIRFDFLENLEKFQTNKGLHLANKLSINHINFQKNKMKSKLAIQLFSNSVANALEYLLNQGVDGFQDSEATIEFLRVFNNLFDIMNSKSKHGKGYRQPYCNETHPEFFPYLQYCRNYITHLTCFA